MTHSRIVPLVAGAVLGAGAVLVFVSLAGSAGETPPASDSERRAPVQPPRLGANPASAAAGAEAAELSASCPTQLAAMADRLATVERTLENRLTLDEMFERGGRGANQHEAALRTGLEKVFEGAPEGYTYQVECRGTVCRIEVFQPERGPAFDWNRQIQEEALHGVAQSYMMTSGTPSHDLVSKDALMSHLVYAEMNRDGTVNGGGVLAAVIAHLESTGAPASCAASDPTEGFLSLRLDLDPGDRVITYAAGGTVASSPVGRCLLAAVERAIVATPVPENARFATMYHTIETPPR